MDSGEVDKKKRPVFVEMPDGTPIDIPEGRFIDLRVEMPARDDAVPSASQEVELENYEDLAYFEGNTRLSRETKE
ncbi:hypothetical protein [Serratia fonticola]|uniref:Phage tail protein C-terminal domain-containing protein n=1 Tax=Serratia fonticola TaxID=47917 RepID=A0A3S4X207_SERFO|nr:Uncharacterised protein [Serratia fonticola]